MSDPALVFVASLNWAYPDTSLPAYVPVMLVNKIWEGESELEIIVCIYVLPAIVSSAST